MISCRLWSRAKLGGSSRKCPLIARRRTTTISMVCPALRPLTSDKRWERFHSFLNGSILSQVQVMRQSSSIGPMINEASVYEENGLPWSQTVNRYVRFMCLPLEAPVPPVDVDIIWHTHQLKGTRYRRVIAVVRLDWLMLTMDTDAREDCIKYFGRVINHDDSKPADVVSKCHAPRPCNLGTHRCLQEKAGR